MLRISSICRVFVFPVALSIYGCALSPPRQPENVCAIFAERPEWKTAAERAASRHGVPVGTLMAFVFQESGFNAEARPPRTFLLGIIPWSRASSAYGYGQVKDETWAWYRRRSGLDGVIRTDFGDVVAFIAWYCRQSIQKFRLKPTDTMNLYLAYHEGLAGFQRASYKEKPWLATVARRVANTAHRYEQQLQTCS